MLTEEQITSVWERQIAAEVRALYFADLATHYTTQKQWISGASFFLASGAAATLLAKSPTWVPLLLACLTALLSAYSVARGLDGVTRNMSKFQFSWSELASGYEALWNNIHTDDAHSRLDLLISRERDLSSQASTEAPTIKSVWPTGKPRSFSNIISRQHEPGERNPGRLATSAPARSTTTQATTAAAT